MLDYEKTIVEKKIFNLSQHINKISEYNFVLLKKKERNENKKDIRSWSRSPETKVHEVAVLDTPSAASTSDLREGRRIRAEGRKRAVRKRKRERGETLSRNPVRTRDSGGTASCCHCRAAVLSCRGPVGRICIALALHSLDTLQFTHTPS